MGGGAGSGVGSGGGGFLPQPIQTVINSFRYSTIGGGAGGSTAGGHPLISSSSSQLIAHPPNLAISPEPFTKQEEKRLHLENQWRVDIMRLEVDATATEKSHEDLAMVLAQAQERERVPLSVEVQPVRYSGANCQDDVDQDDRVAPLKVVTTGMSGRVREGSPLSSASSSLSSSSARTPSLTSCSSTVSSPTTLTTPCCLSAYENMDLFGLQRHPVWDPLMDRLTKFDTTHHELDARNIFHFFRRMSLDSPTAYAQQSPMWFRLSSSANAVQAIFQAGGVILYLKELQQKDSKKRDPIQTVHPVTLKGYFKRLLKDCGGLLLKETTALFVELARPATDNGEKLSRIDRALLYRVICLDYNRGRVFLRISRVME
ncbi:hypothetical protein BGW39_001454 [Mortierella sp. 14UC]|nr:hypothetical protein BGW39_001454 [Mortierella sp. 14UC]